MGVRGLSGFLRGLGLDRDGATATTLLPGSTTLAIDGNGLVFHLFRLAYRRHRQDVLSASNQHCKALLPEILLPSFTPLSLADDVTTTYLSELTVKHGLHLQIYFDGPDQYMKRHEKQLRKERRKDEWENTRQLCLNGILPQDGPSKFRSSAWRQAREHERRSSSSGDAAEEDGDSSDTELYLSSFPLSPLILEQIERSILAFVDMSALLLSGSAHIVRCDGEADAAVAQASAKDITGTTYALANDSDFLIYGCMNERFGDTKYIQFQQLDSSADSLCVGAVLTRSDVAGALGLPCPEAMVELSVLLGNDYTGPFVQHDNAKKRKEYRSSMRWYRDGEHAAGSDESARLPPESELSRFDIQGIADHVAENVADGLRLMSDIEELQRAIQFSNELYSFCDISSFPTTAPGSTSEDDALNDIVVFPSLSSEFKIFLARDSPDSMDLCEAALLPLTAYMSEIASESNDMPYVEKRHLDAFRMTLDRMRSQNEPEIEPPQRKMQWTDMQALYVLERCLWKVISNSVDAIENIPCRVFSHSIFHSCLESLTFEDYPLDDEPVSNNEEAFLEEDTDKLPANGEEEPVKKLVLPIDEHKDNILHTIKTQRVTIIHGETGCGKSSRVPCFLLRAEPPEPTRNAPEVKMIVSQPRRIAAKALAERVRSCEPDIAHKIGLRMGHGIREHETAKTRAWFVTTGYVVRLLGNHPGWFASHTHLIIDEVHERSIDTDILCLLCRRLLQSHPTIRLVLMSATMAANLYCQYFGSPQPPIHVGVRCFPIREIFVEDLRSLLSLPPKSAKLAQDTYNFCEKSKCDSAPSAANMEKLYQLATQITASVGGNGSSVLIFVPGMRDIEAIIELIEKLNVSDASFICLPIHSDVPFEEQMAAFEPPKEGEVKVIIATNAAESSLTLPDVDHVICLGLCKQIVYNKASHRQMLAPCWISKASATQRAGRTGRVRPGNVYRLYSRDTLNKYMEPFDQGELVRTPLDSTILSLREMLNEAVTPILLDCLEPPDISNIDRSFQSLHASNFISNPTDEGEITSLGSLVVALGIDLTLGAFVGLGIQFGVAAEAIQLAAILSSAKTPWAISSPMYHDIDTFNTIVSKTFTSRCFFDAGLYSEPLAISNLLHDYSQCKEKTQFCWKHRVVASRMRYLSGTVESLKKRVAKCLNVHAEVLEIKDPPRSMSHAKVNILRVLQIWLFYDTIIVQNPSKSKIERDNGSISIQLDGPPIGRDHLAQVLDAKLHPFVLENRGKIVQQGDFNPAYLSSVGGADYFESFETRFVSYALEKNIDLSLYFVGTSVKLVVPADIWEQQESAKLRASIIGKISVDIKQVNYCQNTGGNQRGRLGRACGSWYPLRKDILLTSDSVLPSRCVFVLSGKLTKSQAKEFKRDIDATKINSINCCLSCNITQSKKKVLFSIASSGECHGVSNSDLCDLFAAPDVTSSSASSTIKQCVNFPHVKSNVSDDGSSNSRPLIEDSPEGGRLLSVLASERRRDNFIRFSDGFNEQTLDEIKFIDVNLPKTFSINGNKWKQKDGGGMVFVPENNVPVAAIPTNKNLELFCCCANTLDLRGGACRVEGITMLPPGRLFVALSLLCFGINPRTCTPIDLLYANGHAGEEKKEAGGDYVVQDALSWIYEKSKLSIAQQEHARVVEALDFHSTCMELGETLETQPDKILALCALLDEADGYSMTVWEGYDLSLKAAMASVGSKTIHRITDRHINNTININKEKSYEATAVQSTTSDNHQHEHSRRSKPNTTKLAKNQSSTKATFACTGCKVIFANWFSQLEHRPKCCPGTRLSKKQSIFLANHPKANDPKSEYDKAKPKQSNKPMNGDLGSKTMWVCQSCEEVFGKRKQCDKHIEKCSFGLVQQTKSKLMYVCELCSKMFETSKACRSHMKGCHAGSIVVNGDLVPKTMWVCQSCEEMFGKKKECDKHIKKCSFGLVQQTKSKLMYACEGCSKMFESSKECLSHIKGCNAGSIVADAAPKVKKRKA